MNDNTIEVTEEGFTQLMTNINEGIKEVLGEMEEHKVTMTEQKLFDILVKYYQEQISVAESIKQTLQDAKEDLDKDDVATVNEAAKSYAKQDFDKKYDKWEALKEKYNELIGEGY